MRLLPANIGRDEGIAAAWSFAYFFLLLSGYYVLRPIRDEMGISAGAGKLDELFTWTFLGMLVLVPAWSWVVARYPRRRIIPIAYHAFAACLVGFAAAWSSDLPEHIVAQVFFVWLSVYNVFVVSVFWSFMADVYNPEQAKRLYGVIAAGGSAGAIAGPLATALLVERLGLVPMLAIAAILLELCVVCVVALVRRSKAAGPGALSRHADEIIGGSSFAGFRLAVRSPYLLAIGGQIALYGLVSTVLYFEQARMVAAAVPDAAARTALFAKVDLAVNVLTVLVEVVATGWILSRVGLAVALVTLPVLTIFGSFALAATTTLPVLIVFGVARRVAHFAVDRPAREVLFTVVGGEEN